MVNFLLWLWICFGATVSGAELQVSVVQRDMVLGQSTRLEVQVVDGRPDDVPELTVGRGVQVQYQGQSQSHMMVNFESSRIFRYTFVLTAIEVGTWKVAPNRVKVGSEWLETEPVVIRVAAQSAKQQSKHDVSGSLSDRSPFVGEAVVYTFRYVYRDAIYDARWTPPAFDGFVEEQVAQTTQSEGVTAIEQSAQGTTGGDAVDANYQEISVPLVAVGEGPRTVAPAMLTVKVPSTKKQNKQRRRSIFDAPFGGNRTESLSLATKPIKLDVRPLPTEGRGANFSGLVGRFRVEVSADMETVQLGESVTLDIRVVGNGTLVGFALPAAEEGAGFRVYDDEPELVSRVKDGQVLSMAVFRRAVVPDAEGDLTLPPIKIEYFDPETEAYRTMRSKRVRLTVTPGEQGASAVASFSDGQVDRREAIQTIGDDYLPVSGTGVVRDHSLHAILPWLVGLPMIPFLGLVGAGGRRWFERHRSRGAPRRALYHRLLTLPDLREEQLSVLEDVLRDWGALEVSVSPAEVDQATMDALGDEVGQVWRDLLTARYGRGDLLDLVGRVRRLLESK